MVGFKDMLFPQEGICLFCLREANLGDGHICRDCMKLLELVHGEVDFQLPGLGMVYYSTLYNRFMRKRLHEFKFQDKSYLYRPFGQILADTVGALKLYRHVDAIAFVPVHRIRRAIRGYNQSQLLADYLSKEFSIPLLNKHIRKTRWTKDQNKLGGMARRANLRDCFRVMNREDFEAKEILLIDDIITTGTTMGECGSVLAEGGAKKVYGLALTSSRYH